MKKARSSPSAAREAAPGAFRSDGSYDPEAPLERRGHLDGLVRALVAQRRRGELSLALAARAIEAANALAAFPNSGQWEGCDHWSLAVYSTSAEETVKREGRGVAVQHWCGQRWTAGLESACREPRHRPTAPDPGFLDRLTQQTAFATAMDRSLEHRFSPPPVPIASLNDDDTPPPAEYR